MCAQVAQRLAFSKERIVERTSTLNFIIGGHWHCLSCNETIVQGILT